MPRQTTVCGGLGFCGGKSHDALRRSLAKGSLVALLFATAIYLSTQAAVPDVLPGIALGWKALFHVERAGAILGAMGGVLLIAWRALSGEFPTRFGNIEYAPKDVTDEVEEVSASQERRLRALEEITGLRDSVALESSRIKG
jgi:hypothetical protein